jgi:AmmeMemoRadiSam system protein B/AmmeMemoRadiSam system protein A
VAGKHFSRVVIMGPSHHLPMENVSSVPDATHYATPLGEVPLDTDFIASLLKHTQFKTIPGAETDEHSVQIQIPFLQRTVHDFKLVPIVVGQLDADTTRAMAKILTGLIDADTLIVASSDFTHYGPNYGYMPFKGDVQDNLKKLDIGAWDCIQKKDAGAFEGYVERTGDTICGHCPIGVLLSALPADSEPHLLKYDTSGHITGDTTNSVSYLSIAFAGAWAKGAPVVESKESAATLTDEDRTQLLALARGTLEGYVKDGRMPTPEKLGIKVTPGMSQNMGAFVTLTEKGELRGCIGEIIPMRALYKAVMEHAVDAGENDNRFRPVVAAELPLLHYEITAWPKAPVPVASYKDIVLGRHGIVLSKDGHRALFLPQVPGEQDWDIDQTLTHLSVKAGLSPDAWKEGASFSVFEGIIFSEKEK